MCGYEVDVDKKVKNQLELLWKKACKGLNFWISEKVYPKIISHV